ncbi:MULTISPECIES: GSCFA domain-containing protein [Flavobacterium]|uniref:GSCFA domain-containing protein n=2 Tax=Flavobacterium TaxID=237 RepID=A0AA94F2B5_9FLAO|nr:MULTISPECIES: GSCFA domain-containing protein [Flavobacterium]OXA76693.1 GSCFA domain-containing protein [Flavobacterium columnare NBRC 100251 = ATCC 23463]AMA49678.1 GSCFA domain-containing protein [Flavobacterium covae]AND63367.1 GSCFA domain-containing protein [Flavobacterium covae]MCH4828386.1 GSCFA domain-containing protein [Flavobacterium columnare]MCH4832214.1 GSCFA domain-containing protein [Flavobacterium columnare]
MIFSLKIPIDKTKNTINYQSDLLLLGSCFSENIGNKFSYFKFKTTVNPFGIIFNPISIEKLIKRIVEKKHFTEEDIFFHNDLWHCFEIHSELSNPDKENFLKTLNDLIEFANKQIKEITHCILTLGTSWVYRINKTGETVANCHKVPQKEFTKELLSVEVIQQSLINIVLLVRKINPDVKFIFTISPVRHIKDGFFENNVSKGNLFLALHKTFSISKIEEAYFPSYEIVMDELRDYRFYEKDLLHPNELAIDYIWERFSEIYFETETQSLMLEVKNIQKDLAHRPFNPNTEKHQKFLEKIEFKKALLFKKIPHLSF